MGCDNTIRWMSLVAALAISCSPAGGGKPSVTPTAGTVSDYEPARGASALWVSPNGNHLAAELTFVGEELPAVIKVISAR
jgi:hypothetical protein